MLMILSRQSLSGTLSTTLIISGVLLMVGVTYLLFIMPNYVGSSTNLWLGDGVFKAKLATDDKARVKGLSGLSSMDEDEALIMAYSTEAKWGIWMKDMNFPIDIVWLDKNKKVVSIVKNVSHEESTTITHKPKALSKYVVELVAGTVDKKSIKVNRTAIFQIDEKGVR